MDVSSMEAAEASINQFIERRAKDSDEQHRVEEYWTESVSRHHERRREQNKAAWYAHHDHMRELHTSLAAEHEARAKNLCEEKETTDD